MKPKFFALFFVFIFFSLLVAAQAERKEPTDYLPFDPFTMAVYVFGFVLVLSVYSIFYEKKLSEQTKKIIFVAVALPTVVATLYMAGTTVYLNLISESGGPVHWHADYEVWVCGEHLINFEKPVFPSNKVGSPVFHHHDDFRMHIEGLVIDTVDVSLGEFFKVIGGDFTGESFTMVNEDLSKRIITNGELCNGRPAKWRLYAKNWGTSQFEEKMELEDYVIQPHFNVPPGDYLFLVFDSVEGVPSGS